jgi:HPt (histidine-containing phosphotransfer) domain-containing protein
MRQTGAQEQTVGSTKHRLQKSRAQGSAKDDFDELRDAFHARLQIDRVHLVTLSAALAGAEDDPGKIFDDLVFRAHRIRGGASIFEFADVAAAANALEQAAIGAHASHAGNADSSVWTALVALVRLMGSYESTGVDLGIDMLGPSP